MSNPWADHQREQRNEHPLDVIESRVTDLTPEASEDAACDLLLKIESMKRRLRELESAMKPKLIEFIKAIGKPLMVGTVKYFVGRKKVTKCTDRAAALEAMFVACDGDFAKVVDGLSSDAFKHGWCEETLPADVYAKCFATVYEDELKHGKPQAPELQKIDTRFLT